LRQNRHYRRGSRRNLAGDDCKGSGDSRMIRYRAGILAMTRSPGAAGFSSRSAPVTSSRLIDAVAASLALGALSLCLVVTITVLSIGAGFARPI
jgi:hypothetical protein